MSSRILNGFVSVAFFVFLVIDFSLVLATSTSGQTQSQTAAEGFATPKEAADALIHAAADYDFPAMQEILGQDGKDLVASADSVEDKNRAAKFAALAKEKSDVVTDPKDKSHATLTVGNDDWPLPIPIVMKRGNGISIPKPAAMKS